MVSKAAMQYHKRADWRTIFGVCCQTGDHVIFFWIATAAKSRLAMTASVPELSGLLAVALSKLCVGFS